MPIKPLTDTPLLKEARERWKLANESDEKQAGRERDDLAFYAGEQWPTDIQASRMGQAAQGGATGMPAVPARPTLVINKVREPVRQVQNEIRDSDIGAELTPANDFGDLGITPDDTEIATREGLLRRTLRDSDAQEARNWAGDRASIAGRGYYLVMTRFLPGKTNDQEVYVDRIYNQAGVLLDPSHTQPDGSDADWGFVGTWMPWDRYKGEYPKLADGQDNDFAEATEADFISLTEAYPTWYKAQGENRAVRVVDYWYTERTARELVTLETGETVWSDEAPEGATTLDSRTVIEKSIKFCKIGGGIQELEKTDWLGPDIPIIEVVGEELQPYDEQRRIEGIVRNARGAQQGTNYLVSKFVETVGLSAIPRDRVDPDAISGYEAWWEVANTRTLPYLPYRSRDDNGKEFNAPAAPTTDPNIYPIAQGISLFDQFVKSTTAVPDPTLGNVDPSLKSGRAIRETVANAKASTSNFASNRIRSMKREVTVINNLLYPVYGKPFYESKGSVRQRRLLRIVNGEGEPDTMVLEPSSKPGQMPQGSQSGKPKAKLTKDATFNVAIKVTKNYDTRRQQENSEVGELIASNPEAMMAQYGDLYFQSSDIPNRKQYAERARVMLAPPIQQLLAAKAQNQAPIPPEVQQQMAQMQEQLQMAEAALKELSAKAEGKQMEQDTKLQVEQMQTQRDVALAQLQAQTDLEKAKMDNATKIRVAEIAAETKGIVSAQAMEHEAISLAHTQQHEATQAADQREHEARVGEQAQRHEAALTAGAQEHESTEAERNRLAKPEGGQE